MDRGHRCFGRLEERETQFSASRGLVVLNSGRLFIQMSNA